MKILALKPGHDGHVCLIEDGRLMYSIEAEKDSGRRYAELSAIQFLESAAMTQHSPDAVVISGWSKGGEATGSAIGDGYCGLSSPTISRRLLLGQPTLSASSSHERSHILCSYGLSPFAQGIPCYALVWEGYLGSFYSIDASLNIEKREEIMVGPGDRYAFVYGLADPNFPKIDGKIRLSDAGKVMALAGFARGFRASSDELEVVRAIMRSPLLKHPLRKDEFLNTPIHNAGVDSLAAKRLSRLVSDSIFDLFMDRISSCARERRPLLISGGCGLNCEWNTRLRQSGLFSEVFVPPCTNDVGVAIGSAIDVQHALIGSAKVSWKTYAGPKFQNDIDIINPGCIDTFKRMPFSHAKLAHDIAAGSIVAWVTGRMEIGPRALGARSILASPLIPGMRDRLNAIKDREEFRPIAPVCLEGDTGVHFSENRPSPHMLYFFNVINPALSEITHVDGTARVQTLAKKQNASLYELLASFREHSGVGVLCNTSLNFKGAGFINRASDLVRYCKDRELDGFVIDENYFVRA
jgi:hydroxymethyl cephem carbamoyltransferase